MAEKLCTLRKRGGMKGIDLSTAWTGIGNFLNASTYTTFNNLEVGKKYLVIIQSFFNSGSINVQFSGATSDWLTPIWSTSVGGYYIRNTMYCITASATTVTVSTGITSNTMIIASEDGGIIAS